MNIPSVIVLPFKDLGWFSRNSWLGAGIANTLIEKFRALRFIRVFSLLATDQILDARKLIKNRPGTPSTAKEILDDLPLDILIFGTSRITRTGGGLTCQIIGSIPGSNELIGEFSFDQESILDAIHEISDCLRDALFTVTGQSEPVESSSLIRFRQVGIPISWAVYEMFCKATNSRFRARKRALYEYVLEHQPNYAAAWGGLGTHHARNNNLDEAISCFRKQIELTPEDHQGYSSLATAYKQSGLFDSALSTIQQAVTLYPQGDADTFHTFATIFHELGRGYGNPCATEQFNEAITYYRKALECNPVDPDVYFDLGKCFIAQNNFSGRHEARQMFKKALELYGPMFSHKRKRVQQMLDSLPI